MIKLKKDIRDLGDSIVYYYEINLLLFANVSLKVWKYLHIEFDHI